MDIIITGRIRKGARRHSCTIQYDILIRRGRESHTDMIELYIIIEFGARFIIMIEDGDHKESYKRAQMANKQLGSNNTDKESLGKGIYYGHSSFCLLIVLICVNINRHTGLLLSWNLVY